MPTDKGLIIGLAVAGGLLYLAGRNRVAITSAPPGTRASFTTNPTQPGVNYRNANYTSPATRAAGGAANQGGNYQNANYTTPAQNPNTAGGTTPNSWAPYTPNSPAPGNAGGGNAGGGYQNANATSPATTPNSWAPYTANSPAPAGGGFQNANYTSPANTQATTQALSA